MALIKRDRFLYGMLLPIAIMVFGMIVIMNMESGAAAAEFAALGVLFMLLVALPITLVVNAAILLQDVATIKACFLRGMIVPVIVLITASVYQSGLWDRLT